MRRYLSWDKARPAMHLKLIMRNKLCIERKGTLTKHFGRACRLCIFGRSSCIDK